MTTEGPPAGNGQESLRPQAGPSPKTLPTVALVLGIASVVAVVLLSILTTVLLALAAVVVGWVSLVHVRRGAAQKRGLAIAGIVLGILAILLSIAGFAMFAGVLPGW